MAKSTVAHVAGAFLVLFAAALASCAKTTSSGFSGGGEPDSGGGDGNDLGDSSGSSSGSSLPDGASFVTGDGSSPTQDTTLTCNQLTRPCSTACTDFPSMPLLDTGAPANAATYFTAADGTGAGPCLSDPAPGTLFPQNWLRPRFQVIPTTGQNLFEITLTSTRQANTYTIYTTNDTWTMPKSVWDALRGDSWGDTVNVKIRGVNMSGGAPTSTTGSFTIAPALAGGSMIYWAAVGDIAGMSWLEGFAPGDESVATTLTTGQVQLQTFRDGNGNLINGGAVQCIGCHAAVPDGNSVTFLDTYPWPGAVASVTPVGPDGGTTTEGQTPSWLTPGGSLALSMPWLGATTFSKADWANEKVVVSSFGCGSNDNGITNRTSDGGVTGVNSFPYIQTDCQGQPDGALLWIDLAASGAGPDPNDTELTLEQKWLAAYGTSWGYIPRTGDPNGVEFPNWSHDGKTIVYTATNAGQDGRLAGAPAQTPASIGHLYSVPFNAKMGGAATPVPGASDAAAWQYYPAFSADDKYLAFVSASQLGNYNGVMNNGMYYNSYDEVYVVPFGGATATATRLAANDPPACVGVTSPGLINSWPKWSPDVESCPDGNTYYWIVFSSARDNVPFKDTTCGPVCNTATPPVCTMQCKSPNLQNGVLGPTSQLYITGVSVDNSTGKITTYPALYLWNQPSTNSLAQPGSPQSNHTPIWELVSIPRPPPPPQ
jgi:hypothetical protein